MSKPTRFILVGLAAAILAGVSPSRASAVCGDVNNDGVVNANDIVCLSAIVAAVTPPAACSPGATCSSGSCDLFNDGPGAPDNTDLAVLVDDFNGLETLHDPCAPVGASIQPSCTGAADAETGKPTYAIGGAGDVTINASQIWPNTCTIILQDTVFVQTDPGDPTTVLTIQPGTVIKGESGHIIPVTPALFILPGSKISAIGTPSQPIVFTSSSADGAKTKGDWGGLNINGRSIVNRSLVGPCMNQAEGIPAPYGGCIENDSSGEMQFVRVEFAGLDFTPNNELNLITRNGVGSGSKFRFLEANAGDDDCHEWFGGTVNEDHLVAAACADDAFDFQLGFQGSLQFGLLVQNGNLTDSSPSRDSRGIEGDNSEFDNSASPQSNPAMCNLTLLGSGGQVGENGGSDVGTFFRRGAAGTFANMIVQGFQDAGLELRDAKTTEHACNVGDPFPLVVENSVYYQNGTAGGSRTEHCKRSTCVDTASKDQNARCTGAGAPDACCTGAGTGTCPVTACNLNSECTVAPDLWCHVGNGVCSPCDYFGTLTTVTDNGSNLCNPGVSGDTYPVVDVPDYRPTFTGTCPSATDCSAIRDNFVNTSYIGAIDPGASCSGSQCDWLSTPWLNFGTNTNAYP